MGYKIDNTPISDIVAGFGTDDIYNGYACEEVSNGFKINEVTAKAVLRNLKFMPFSDFDRSFMHDDTFLKGIKKNSAYVISNRAWAGVNRFILSSTPRFSIREFTSIGSGGTPPSNERRFYFVGGGKANSLGHLYMEYDINGKTYESDIGAAPPVVLLAMHGNGGQGGSGAYDSSQFGGSCRGGGGGGGSGGFVAFYCAMDYSTTRKMVFKINYSSSTWQLAGGNGNYFASVEDGKNGGNGYAHMGGFLWLTAEMSGGAGGAGGKCSVFTPPSNFTWGLYELATSGYTQFVNGRSGGSGGTIRDSETVSIGSSGSNSVYNWAMLPHADTGFHRGAVRDSSNNNYISGGGAASVFSDGNGFRRSPSIDYADGTVKDGIGQGGGGGGGRISNGTFIGSNSPTLGGKGGFFIYW